MEIKLKDTRTLLHICRQGLPSFILISNNLIVEQLRKEASGTSWPGGHCRHRQSPCLRSVRPPTTTTPNSSSPYLIFLEISLVFTHGITLARVNVGVLGTGVPRLACLRRGSRGSPARPIFISTSSRPSRGAEPREADDRKPPQARPR